MGDFTDEFKVSIIADATAIEQKIKESSAKLEAFRVKANQQAQIKLRLTIAELDSQIGEARKRLSNFKKEGDKSAEIKTRLEISGLQQNKTQASKILRDLQNDTVNTGKSFFSLNGIVSDALKAFGAFTLIRKTAQALQESFNAAVSFESAFAGVKKTVEGTPEDFAILEEQFRKLAKQIPLTVEELSKIGEIGGQLGVGKDDIIEFTKTIAKIGVSTNLTQEAAATSFAKIANIFQAPITEVSNLASAVVALGNDSSTTESQILDFATNIAASGKLAGLTQADIAGISAAFSSVGIDAEAGGTAVSKTLQAISDAVNKGGKDLTNFGAVSGLNAKQFTALWKSNPAKAFEAFVTGLGKSGQKGSEILEELVGGDVRLKRAFLSVANAGELLTKSVDLSNNAFAKNTALSDEAAKRFETTQSKVTELGNRFNDLKISFGRFLVTVAVPFLDFLVTLAEALGGASNKLSFLASVLKTAGVALSAALSISLIQKIASGFGALITAINGTSIGFKAAAASGAGFSGVLGAIRVAFSALLGPVGLFVAAAAAVTLGLFESARAAHDLEIATTDLKKVLNENLKTPTLDTLNKKFQETLENAHKTAAELTKINLQKAIGVPTIGPVGVIPATLTTPGPKDLPSPFASPFIDAGANEAFQAATAKSAESLKSLKLDFENLLAASGLSKNEIIDFTSTLDLYNGRLELSQKDIEMTSQKLQEASPNVSKLAADFSSSVDRQVAAGRTLKEAIKDVMDANKIQFEENGQNAEIMGNVIKDEYIKNVATSKGLGEAAAIAYGENYNSSDTRALLKASGVAISDQILLQQLVAAEASGKNGEAAGLLLALGIGSKENLKEVEDSGKDLNKAIQNTFNAAKPSISASGKGAGSSLVAGIINGINEKLPTLGNLLSGIVKSLGGLSSLGGTFGKAAEGLIGADNIKKVQGFLGQLGNQASELQNQFNALKNISKNPGKEIPNLSGGGSGKGLDEAKKKAQEAERAVDEFTKSVDSNNKASEKLRDNIVQFYKDIIDSIDKAKEKQASLRDELTAFKEEQNQGFAKNTGERDLNLEKEKDQLTADKKALEKDLADSKAEFIKKQAELQSGGGSSQDIIDLQTDQRKEEDSINAKILEKDKAINDVLAERKQIQDFLAGLNADASVASKKLVDEFTEARRRATLTEFEQNKLELEDKIKQKEAEVQLEIDKQQQIIDIQNRFLELQNAKGGADLKKKQDLIKLANSGQLLSEDQKQKELTRLGFEDLTKDQELELLKQVQKASALEVEKQQIAEQQQAILTAKNDFQKLAEDYHGESVDRMKEKENELIALIKTAQAEQIALNSLRSAASTAANAVGNNTTFNVTNNNTSTVDFEAGTNNFLNKVK